MWGQFIDPPVNRNGIGLGFSMKKEIVKPKSDLGKYQDIFHSGGYLHPTIPKINAILEGESEQQVPNYVTHGVRVQNWITIDVLSCIHI